MSKTTTTPTHHSESPLTALRAIHRGSTETQGPLSEWSNITDMVLDRILTVIGESKDGAITNQEAKEIVMEEATKFFKLGNELRRADFITHFTKGAPHTAKEINRRLRRQAILEDPSANWATPQQLASDHGVDVEEVKEILSHAKTAEKNKAES